MLFVRSSFVALLSVLSFPLAAQQAKTAAVSTPDTTARAREKIHLHTDKDMYLPGETIWFKAYVVSDGLPALATTNLYVNLLQENGGVLQKKLFPLSDATGDGSFTLPDSLDAANLLIAAYTINTSDSALVYYKHLSIVSKKTKTAGNTPGSVLQFLPEGGTFISGVPNHLAFKADLGNGFPFDVKGTVQNSAGAVIDSFAASHNGMGEIIFTPIAGEKYTAEWTDEKNTVRQNPLPPATSGIAIHTEQVNGFLYYVIQNPTPDENLTEINIDFSQDDEKIYTATLDMSSVPVLSGKIPLHQLRPGVARITASGKNKEPLAERISFIPTDFHFDAMLTLAVPNTGKRAKNTIEIEVPDTLAANLSLSVYDAQFGTGASADIYSDLMLTNDIKGYVHEPGWYFANTSAERKKGLDLVMLTNGWRKYSRVGNNKPDNYISLSGAITDLEQKALPNQSLTLLLQSRDSTKQFYNVVTDRYGRFNKGGLIFYDTANVGVWYRSDRKPSDPDMQLVMDKTGMPANLFQRSYIPPTPYPLSAASALVSGLPEVFIQGKVADGFTDKGFRLNDVSVKSRNWRNNPMLLMDEKYTTGIFRGNATAFSFDVMNDPMSHAKGDVMNYLLGKVPGLTLEYPRAGKIGGLKRLMYGSGTGKAPLTFIFIDEHPFLFDPEDPAAYSEIQGLNMEEIAYIKFFDRYPLQPDKPALSIYLKKGNEANGKIASELSKQKVAGYSTVKEFYSPDYSVAGNQKALLDKRTTLLWQPYIYTDRNNHKVTLSFYNNDISSDLHIVLEGMNELGKLVRVDKVVK